MKGRWLSLFVGLLFGFAIGYLTAQREERKRVFDFMQWAGSTMTEEGVRLYEKAKGTPPAQPNSSTNVAAPAKRAEAVPDKLEYIRQSLRLTDVKTTLEPPANEVIVVSGRVRNLGEHPLREIVLDLFFLGADGFMDDKRVEVLQGTGLPAWQERAFSFRIPNVKGTWSTSRASVVDIAF